MRYKLFGKHTGLRVSELVLRAGNFGTRWGHGAEPDEARRILDAYADAGATSSTPPTVISSASPRRSWAICWPDGATTSCWPRSSP